MNVREAAETIKRTVDMSQILDMYGMKTDRAGFLQCPFHAGDHTASLKVYKGNRGWSCFGCHKGGTVIDFVMQMDSLTFREAVDKIDEQMNLHLMDYQPMTMNTFIQQRTQQARQLQEYGAWMEAVKRQNRTQELILQVRWQMYYEAITKPIQERTDLDWWIILEEECYQPEEWQGYWKNKQREEVSFYGFIAEGHQDPSGRR